MSLLNKVNKVDYFEITSVAAGGSTDQMLVTVTAKNRDKKTVLGNHRFEFWFSEDAGGAGLTGDTYSGALTATKGAILTALTAKKHAVVVTDDDGIATLSIVDSANPTDQYPVVANPRGDLTVGAVSGTNWEGA